MRQISFAFLTAFVLFVVHVSTVSAQTNSAACVSSTSVCTPPSSPHWEFDTIQGKCYQPFAQCGGTQFTSQADCESACLTVTPIPSVTIIPTTPVVTATPSTTISPSPSITQEPSPSVIPECKPSDGDANNDGKATLKDYEIFRQEYSGEEKTLTSDFNCDGKITLIDFEKFRSAFIK